ncbi:3'-5' exoribonuclease YhaM family protein [Paenibacillus faecalis]|uniref:3'-5' exoribonuclease YhaM family protein n=1 Tax=Paenibacillus faecalis TaxID=2079532 RepID=UPI000D10F84A|nr:HD domain-containing protein [Paenibacillus faecalis]
MKPINKLNVQDEFIGFYLLKELNLRQTNSTPPKDYFDIVLSDSSGQISAKYWDVTIQDKETFLPMQLVKIQGVVQNYRNQSQVKINKIRRAREDDGVSLTDFVRCAPIRPVDLLHTIKLAIHEITDQDIRNIVQFCVGKVEEKLMHYPAAKTYHHAYFAGLAYHIVRMLEIGDFICKQRPFLNPDLLKAGIILHDIAKPEEMIAQMGIVTDYSNQGKLVGHIVMASNWIVEAAITHNIPIDFEIILGLQHLVLSHHNLGEWGSPVQPQTAEAVALHYIDLMDAKLQMVEDALDTTADTEPWTSMIRGLENKSIYRLKV